MELGQYNIVLVNLDPTIGSEIKKTRPCVIISPNEINQNLNVITVAPITSTGKKYPTRVPIKRQKQTGFVVIDQIRSIDKKRVIKTLGVLSNSEIKQVKDTIRETFVD